MNDDVATLLAQAKALDIDERIALVQAIWDSIAEETQHRAGPLPKWQREVLDRRLAELALDPGAERSWDEVKADLERLSASPSGRHR